MEKKKTDQFCQLDESAKKYAISHEQGRLAYFSFSTFARRHAILLRLQERARYVIRVAIFSSVSLRVRVIYAL